MKSYSLKCLLAFLLTGLGFCKLSAQCAVSVPNYVSGANVATPFNYIYVQTFKPTCSGTLSSVVFPAIYSGSDDFRSSGYSVECSLRDASGNVIATATKTEQWYPGATVTFNFSCKNTALVSGTTYQWFLRAVDNNTGATLNDPSIGGIYLLRRSNTASVYADGNCILDGTSYPNGDLYGWTVNIAAYNTASTSTTATIDPAVCNLATSGSQAIAAVTATGAVMGNTTVKMTVGATTPTSNNQPYVRRYFDITPTSNKSTATATVTLYFTQADFDNYNANNGAYPDLPTSTSDAVGKANLKITQQHGTSATGAPGSFTGWAGAGNANILIDPSDANIVWNATASRWEVTFSVTGFSGFFVHSGNTVLPVSLTSFTGKRESGVNKLSWTTASESNNRGFSVERSLDGTSYTSIGSVASKADNGNSNSVLIYTYNDNTTAAKSFYRLVQTDFDGKTKTSAIVVLKSGGVGGSLSLGKLYPNPVPEILKLSVEAPSAGVLRYAITDMAGRTLASGNKTVDSGVNALEINLGTLAAGTYNLRVSNAIGESVNSTFVKQ